MLLTTRAESTIPLLLTALSMITLRMKDSQTLNSLNSRNRKRIMEKGVDWLPDASLDKLEDIHQKVDK